MRPDLPSIELSKLKELVNSNYSYTMHVEGNNLDLRFVPNFPEAASHKPNGEEVEHIMSGTIIGEDVFFSRFTTRSSFGETTTELHGKDDPVMLWLNFI